MYLDILIVIILLLTVLKGYLNGFFLETLSFFGVVINILFSRILTPIIIQEFAITPDSSLYPGVYALTFLGIYILMGIFIAFIKRSLRNAFRGKINAIAGAVLGLFKGFIIYFVVLFFYSLLSMNTGFLKKYGEGSYSRKFFIYSIPVIKEYFPKEYEEKLESLTNNAKIDRYLKNILKE